MEEQEQKICPNCKREIPAVNFTIHTVHCARNIKVCPVCKEPVPQSELQEHHDKLHKLVPCKKCGESVCGTDLEDHVRDSCGHTVKSCRFCELELPRHELPMHEGYCGVRTEQCGECGQYVMIRYRQLHLDSDHRLLRRDDDPVPQPKKEAQSNIIKPLPWPSRTNSSSINQPNVRANSSTANQANLQKNASTNPANVQPISSTNQANLWPNSSTNQANLWSNISSTSQANIQTNSSAKQVKLLSNSSTNKANLWSNTSSTSQAKLLSNSSTNQANLRPNSSTNQAKLLSNSSTNQANLRSNSSTANQGNVRPWTSNASGNTANARPGTSKNVNVENDRPRTEIKYFPKMNAGSSSSSSNSSQENLSLSHSQSSALSNGVRTHVKRTNDQPQINTSVETKEKVHKNLGLSRGAVKKRPAPPPPGPPPAALPTRDQPYYSALMRQQSEERARQEQTAQNLAVGLPPVLSPAAKLEKLRKMDTLHNRETNNDQSYKNRLQGRVWMPPDLPKGHILGSSIPVSSSDPERRPVPRPPAPAASLPVAPPRTEPEGAARPTHEDRPQEPREVKPVNQHEFMDRFKSLQLRKDEQEREDRFSEIKSSLRELRRGLNEVTAPYNANNGNVEQQQRGAGGDGLANFHPDPQVNAAVRLQANAFADAQANALANARANAQANALDNGQANALGNLDMLSPGEDAAPLPCEFCGAPVPAYDLVRHQTGCRPDLTQYRGRPLAGAPPPPPPRSPPPDEEPVIPCEFCAEALPFYLITEHQERCGREANLLYPD